MLRTPLARIAVLLLLTTSVAAQGRSRPELGSFGVETRNMDSAVKPGDDFFRYTNGTWLKTFKMPEDQASYGSFNALRDVSELRARTILEQSAKARAKPGTETAKIADLYTSFLDEAGIEKLGLAPVADTLAEIAALKDKAALVQFMGRSRKSSLPAPFVYSVSLDAKNPSQYIVSFSQSGLGMPDRDYYIVDSNPKFVEIKAKYRTYIETMLTLAKISDASAKANRILALETEIARAHWSRVENRDRDKTYNKFAPLGIASIAPEFPWESYLAAGGLGGQKSVLVRQPTALTALAKLYAVTPLADWQDYYTFLTLHSVAQFLPRAFVDARFEFFGKTLSGVPINRERWKRAVGYTNAIMGEAVGREYVKRYFPPQAKQRMDTLVANLKLAYTNRINGLPWMSAETKQKALIKLGKFTTKIGYPEKFRDYSALEIRKGDVIGNLRRAGAFEFARDVARLGGPVDKAEWAMTPQTVNAYYNSVFNEIVFPAAILQAPFFDPAADDAVNYGAIGAVIGHEIGHGFDDQGAKSDGDGVLQSWWTPDDLAQFQKRTGALADQYSGFEALPGLKLNGKLQLGENIGDLGGLQAAHAAYQLSLGGKPDRMIGGFTGEQRFFLGYGQVWRTVYRDAALRQLVQTDPHAPGEFRANGVVRNLDAWYKAFNVEPGDKLYLAPEQRISIW